MAVDPIRVLFIAYYFPPLGGAGVQRSQKFVRYLPDYGVLPSVLTGPIAEGTRWGPLDQTLSAEIPADTQIHRVTSALPPPGNRRMEKLRRWIGLDGVFRKWWVPGIVEAGKAAYQGERVILATMSPFESAEAASVLSRELGIPWIADLRDPWALDEMMIYPSAWHRNREIARMARDLSSAAIIIMNTHAAADAVRKRIPSLASKRIEVITNGYDEADFRTPVTARTDGKFRIVHSGSLHSAGGLALRGSRLKRLLGGVQPGVDILTRSHHVLLAALDRWTRQRPEVRDKVEVVFAGTVSKEDQAIADQSPVSSLVRFTGYLPHLQSTDLIRTADLLFLPMHSLPPGTPSLIVPGKTYEYAATGRPILAAVPDGDVHRILGACGTGLICRPEDEAGMAELLDRAYGASESGSPLSEGFCPEAIQSYERRGLTRRLADIIHTCNSPKQVA